MGKRGSWPAATSGGGIQVVAELVAAVSGGGCAMVDVRAEKQEATKSEAPRARGRAKRWLVLVGRRQRHNRETGRRRCDRGGGGVREEHAKQNP